MSSAAATAREAAALRNSAPAPRALSMRDEDAREEYLLAGFREVFSEERCIRAATAHVISARRAAWEAMDRLRKIVLALDDGNLDVIARELRDIEDHTIASNGVGGYWQEVVASAGAFTAVINVGLGYVREA